MSSSYADDYGTPVLADPTAGRKRPPSRKWIYTITAIWSKSLRRVVWACCCVGKVLIAFSRVFFCCFWNHPIFLSAMHSYGKRGWVQMARVSNVFLSWRENAFWESLPEQELRSVLVFFCCCQSRKRSFIASERFSCFSFVSIFSSIVKTGVCLATVDILVHSLERGLWGAMILSISANGGGRWNVYEVW